MDQKRVFIAIDIPDSWKSEMALAQTYLKKLYPHMQLTPEKNFHVTLIFYGDKEDEEIDAIARYLTELLPKYTKCEVVPGKFGYFFNRERTVLWYGVESPILSSIVDALQIHAVDEDDHSFRAHITLGRINNERIKIEDPGLKLSLDPFVVEKIVMYESTPTVQGPHYLPLSEWTLNG